MKKLILIVAIPLTIICQDISLKESIIESIWDAIETDTNQDITRGDCNFSTQIISLPFTISTPGFYCLGRDLTASTAGALTITTDNVSLDLNGKILNGGTNTMISMSGRTNIFIANGTIRDVTAIGISTTGANREIVLENITILRCSIGMSLTGVTNLFMNGCGVFNCRGTGIVISSPTNGIIKSCVSNNNGTGGHGFSLTSGININLLGCMANSNQGNGFTQQASRNCLYKMCTASSNSGSGFNLVNINAASTTNINNKLKHCSAEQNTGTGFILRGNQNSLKDCSAESNALGFSISGTNHSVVESVAKSNSGNGFTFNGSGATLLNNVANFNGGTGFLLAAAGSGLPISSNTQMRGNTATGNTTAGFNNAGNGAAVSPGGNRVYGNFANTNGTNFIGIANVSTSPIATTAINFTANIAE